MFRQETRSVFLKPRDTVAHLHPLLEPGDISKAGLLHALPEPTSPFPSCLSTIPGLLVCLPGPAHAAGASLRCHQPTTGDNAEVLISRLEVQLEMEICGRAVWQGWRIEEKHHSPALEPLAVSMATSTASPAAQSQLSPPHGHPGSCLLTPLCPLAYLP